MTLLDRLGLTAMKIDKKLLSLVGGTEVLSFGEVYDRESPLKDEIVVGKSISLVDTFRCVNHNNLNYLIQEQHDHFVYNLIMAAIISKFPDAFLKNPLPAIMRSSSNDSERTSVIPFSSSSQKGDVMGQTEKFLQSYNRLASIKESVLLIANELMMNALYCAPIDEGGNFLYLDSNRSTAIDYPSNHKAEIYLSYNENVIVVGCRDSYGSVQKNRVTTRLNEVFQHNKMAQIKTMGREGGSGLGLKLIIEKSSGFGMVVKGGKETFVYAILPLGFSNTKISQMAKNLCLHFY